MSLQSIKAGLSAEAAKLSAGMAVLDALHEVLPPSVAEAMSDLRSTASGRVMVLDGAQLSLKQALELLPAEAAYAAVSGSLEHPMELELLTEGEMRENCRFPSFWPAYPVSKLDSTVLGTYFVWRTTLRSSPVEVHLTRADLSDWRAVADEGLVLTTGSRSVAVPGFVEPDVKSLVTAQETWNAKWEEFYISEAYTAAQLQFARSFRSAAANRVVVTAADLPQPAPITMAVGEEELAILRTGVSPETWPEKSSMRALGRVGSFWGRFTQEEAGRLLQFEQGMVASAPGPDSDYKEIMVVLEKAKQALEQLNNDTFKLYRGKPPAGLLSSYLQAEFGYPIHVSYRDTAKTFGSEYAQEVWVHLQRCNLGAVVKYKGTYEKGDKHWFEAPVAHLKPVSFIS